MSMSFKKIFSLLVSVLALSSVVSCCHTPCKPADDIANRNKMKQFDITYFYGPREGDLTKRETIANIAASGITLMQLCGSPESVKQALPVMAEYGLYGNVFDDRIMNLVSKNDPAAVDAVVKQVVEEYKDFENVIGWEVTDEPNADRFPILAEITKAFNKYAPGKDVVINLFPNYAVPAQLGTEDYMTYLEKFASTVPTGVLSYDHYHFIGRNDRDRNLSLFHLRGMDERERLILLAAENTVDRGGFFENIEDIRNVALKYDMDPMLIVLLVEHGDYRNLTRAEILWEVNMCLVYGMKRLSYFTYWCPGPDEHWKWDNAMCDTQGNKMPHWYDVQAVNAEVAEVGKYLFKRKCQYVAHIGNVEKGAAEFAPYANISAVEGKDGVISFFDDGSIYLVNKDFKKEGTFTVKSRKPLKQYTNGKFINLGSDTVRLAPGQGILLK